MIQNPPLRDDPAEVVKRLARANAEFAADMREKGIHVGLGTGPGSPRCVTCDELWPCSTVRSSDPDRQGHDD